MISGPMHQQEFAGREFVFGRLKRAANLNLETLGRIQFSADGTVTAISTSRKVTWRTSNGRLELFGPQGLTFSTFDRRMEIAGGEIIAGHSAISGNDEFIYPYRPLRSAADRLLYVISSHHASSLGRDALVPQMIAAGVPPERIWLTIAQSPASRITTVKGITYSYTTDNAYEYTVLLDIARRVVPYDLVFMIHDTCHVGPQFQQLVEEQPNALAIDYTSVLINGHYNIGLYRTEFLTRIRPFLESMVNAPKQRAIDIEMNRTNEGFKTIAAVTSNFLVSRGIQTGLHQPYSPGQIRNGTRLPGADIHKFYGMPPASYWLYHSRY